jgi:hypothetical protein
VAGHRCKKTHGENISRHFSPAASFIFFLLWFFLPPAASFSSHAPIYRTQRATADFSQLARRR